MCPNHCRKELRKAKGEEIKIKEEEKKKD